MSNLRLLGLLLGLLGVLFSFLFFRGKNWHKFNFLLSFCISISIFLVSVNPELVNFLRRFLSFDKSEYGRIFGLLVFAVITLFVLLLYVKSRSDDLRYQFDLLVRRMGLEKITDVKNDQHKVKSLMIIIPAFNEAGNLEILLPCIPRIICGQEVGVIVVDDGSSDDTFDVARKHGCFAVRNLINRGQGGSSRLGYDLLAQFNVNIGVTMDADNQHRPEDIEKLVLPIIEDKADLVIGSRVLGGQEKGSRFRQFGIHFFSRLISVAAGVKLTDCSSGFKAFRMEKMKTLHLKEEQFQAAEVLLVAVKNHLRIKEVPIVVRNRRQGESKKGTNLIYGVMFFKTIIKAWWR